MIEPDQFDEKLAGGGSGPTICYVARCDAPVITPKRNAAIHHVAIIAGTAATVAIAIFPSSVSERRHTEPSCKNKPTIETTTGKIDAMTINESTRTPWNGSKNRSTKKSVTNASAETDAARGMKNESPDTYPPSNNGKNSTENPYKETPFPSAAQAE